MLADRTTPRFPHNIRGRSLRRLPLRRSSVYICGIFVFTRLRPTLLPDESGHQLGKLQKIWNAQHPAALAHHDLRIERNRIRPVPRDRADAIVVDAQQEPRAVPVVPLADADETLAAERMERVRYLHKTRGRARRACILA